MKVFTYETANSFDIVFEDGLGKVEAVEEFVRGSEPFLSVFNKAKYPTLAEYEDFCYNVTDKYEKTYLGEL